MKFSRLFLLLFVSIFIFSANTAFSQQDPIVLIKTNMGNMKVKLYNATPKHRDNFLKLTKEKFYDGILFHRVIKDFMIQAGDPASKGAAKDKQLGNGGPGYTIPAEIKPQYFHKKGALSAARQGDEANPARASSGSQFYVVQGKTYSDDALNQMEEKINQTAKLSRMRTFIMLPENKILKDEINQYQRTKNKQKLDSISVIISAKIDEQHKTDTAFHFTSQQRETYKTIGGTPFLDANYTVFGEVIEGLDIIDKIAAVKTAPGDRPEEDVVILSVQVVKE